MRTAIKSLILIASLSGCADVGDFCDIAQDLRSSPETSALIYDTDEALARKMAIHNTDFLRCNP